MSYGQRNSGKTYTMYGPREKKYNRNRAAISEEHSVDTATSYSTVLGSSEEDGIIPRAIHDLFMAKDRQTTGGEVLIHMTFVEIYNDGIVDLLSIKKQNAKVLEIRDNVSSTSNSNNAAGGATIKGLTSIKLRSFSHARHIIDAAYKRRISARSHTICTVHVTINPAVKSSVVSGKLASMTSTDVVSAKLTLVDLAGSQRIRSSNVQKDHVEQKEDASISNDLFVLAKCIKSLASDQTPRDTPNKMKHVPFRDCKLTRILRDSLGGNCCTILLTCISPTEKNLDETLSFLRNAEMSRNISNRIKKNMIKTIALTPAEGAALRRENKVLKSHVLDMTRQMQRIRRGHTQKPEIVFDMAFDQEAQSDKDTLDVKRWRLKCEKLLKLCRDANLSIDGIYDVSNDEESVLKSTALEIQELKEQIHRLISCQVDDNESMTSGITMEVEDFDNQSISSRAGSVATILSLSNQTLKTCELIEKEKMLENEEQNLQEESSEKAMQRNVLEELKEQERILNENISSRQELLDKAKSETDGISKTINLQKEEQQALGEEIQKKLQEIRLYDLQLQEKKQQSERIGHEVQSLKKQIKLLTEEKLALIEQVGDIQNISQLVEELSTERHAKLESLYKLNQANKDLNIIKAERSELLSHLNEQSTLFDEEVRKRQLAEARVSELEARIKQLEEALSRRDANSVQSEMNRSLEIRVSELESIVKKHEHETIDGVPLDGGQNEVNRPPLAKKRKCSGNASAYSPRSHYSGDADSMISVSRLLMDKKKPKISDEQDSVMFGDDHRMGNNDINVSFENHSVVSEAFSTSCNSLTSDQRAIRLHAQKLLFWADKAISSKNDDATASTFGGADKENVLSGSFPKVSTADRRSSGKPLQNVTLDRSGINCQSPHSFPSTIKHKKGCSCTNSIFSGNKEHTEFFLPRLGLACNCGAEKEANKRHEDPTALSAFLRSWQVAFLASEGITSALDLIARHEHQGPELARAMKYWRHSKRMKPARTKSCLVALQIWSKTAKTVLRSNRKNAIQRSKVIERASKPYFLEIAVSESDDVSRMSMEEFHDCDEELLEGEYEI
jgi:Kinesin-like protein